jgi:hypothetical protein
MIKESTTKLNNGSKYNNKINKKIGNLNFISI